jgi:hypothetical protein
LEVEVEKELEGAVKLMIVVKVKFEMPHIPTFKQLLTLFLLLPLE